MHITYTSFTIAVSIICVIAIGLIGSNRSSLNYQTLQARTGPRAFDRSNVYDIVEYYSETIGLTHQIIDRHECRAYTPCNNCGNTPDLSRQFQQYVHAVNYQPEGPTAKYWLDGPLEARGYGFGASLMNRAGGMTMAVRTGRALLTYNFSDMWSYDTCTHTYGINGCDVRRWTDHMLNGLPALNELERVSAEQAAALKHDKPPGDNESMLKYFKDNKYLSYVELGVGPVVLSYIPDVIEPDDRNLLDANLWQAGIEKSGLSDAQPYKHLPPFWWHSQCLRYMLQPLPHTAHDMLQQMGRSLLLSNKHVSRSIDVYDNLADEDTRWQYATTELLTAWRVSALERQHTSIGVTRPYDTMVTPPSLMYVFVRTGDKGQEVSLHGTDDYVTLVDSVHAARSITHVYIGGDSSSSVNELVMKLHDRYTVYTSVLLAEFDEATKLAKQTAAAQNTTYSDPFSSGFVWSTAKTFNDAFKQQLQRRVLLEYYTAALADVHIGTYSSNHCKVAYTFAAAMQNKYTLPMLSLDQGDHRGIARNLRDDKLQRMPHCAA